MKKYASTIGIALLIIAPVLLWLFWPSDEARIRKMLKTTANAIELKDIEGSLKPISIHYTDDRGMSYLLIKRLLEQNFKNRGSLSVSYSNLLIEVNKKTATATMDLSIKEGDKVVLGISQDRQSPAILHLKLEKNRAGKWLVRSSKWPPAF